MLVECWEVHLSDVTDTLLSGKCDVFSEAEKHFVFESFIFFNSLLKFKFLSIFKIFALINYQT